MHGQVLVHTPLFDCVNFDSYTISMCNLMPYRQFWLQPQNWLWSVVKATCSIIKQKQLNFLNGLDW